MEDQEKEVGSKFDIHVRRILLPGIVAPKVPAALQDDSAIGGAVMAVVLEFDDGRVPEVCGSAVFVSPGLAVTAAHIFDEHLQEVQEKKVKVSCLGPRILEGKLDLWETYSISMAKREDLAFLALKNLTENPDDFVHCTFSMTTRWPQPGELVTVMGYRATDVSVVGANASGGPMVDITAGLLLAQGPVAEVFMPSRDSVLMPFASFSIECGTVGGMSGGAVIDGRGYLLGVISRGLSTSDEDGPTFVAWIVNAFRHSFHLAWPPQVWPNETTNLMALNHDLVDMEGREAYEYRSATDYSYSPWS